MNTAIFDARMQLEFGDLRTVSEADMTVEAAVAMANRRYEGLPWQEENAGFAAMAALEAARTFKKVDGKNGLVYFANHVLSQALIQIVRMATESKEESDNIISFSDILKTDDDIEFIENVIGNNAKFSPVSFDPYTDEWDVENCAFYIAGRYMSVREVASRIAHAQVSEEILSEFFQGDGTAIETIEEEVFAQLSEWAAAQDSIVEFVREEKPQPITYKSRLQTGHLYPGGNIIFETDEIVDVVALEISSRAFIQESPLYAVDLEKTPQQISIALDDPDEITPEHVLARTNWVHSISSALLNGRTPNWTRIGEEIVDLGASLNSERSLVYVLAINVMLAVVPHVSGAFDIVVSNLIAEKNEMDEDYSSIVTDKTLRDAIVKKVMSGEIYPDRAVNIVAKLDGLLPNQSRYLSDEMHKEIVRVMKIMNHKWVPAIVTAVIAERVYPFLHLDLPPVIVTVYGDVSADRVKFIMQHKYAFAVTGVGKESLAEELGVPFIHVSDNQNHFGVDQCVAISTHLITTDGLYKELASKLGVKCIVVKEDSAEQSKS